MIEVADLETDLAFLSRNGYVTIDADALLDHLEGRRRAPERAVVLTVDDGARNLYDVAFPLLQSFGMKAVAFIATRFHREDSEDVSDEYTGDLPEPLSWSQIREMHASGVIDFQSHTHAHRYIPRWPEPVVLTGSASNQSSSLKGPILTITPPTRNMQISTPANVPISGVGIAESSCSLRLAV